MQGLQLFLARFYINQVIRPDFRQLLHCIAGNQSENTLLLPIFIGLVAKSSLCVSVLRRHLPKRKAQNIWQLDSPLPPPRPPHVILKTRSIARCITPSEIGSVFWEKVES